MDADMNKCSVCSLQFYRQRDLRNHKMRIHKELLRCNMCEKEFLYKTHLQSHVKTHHKHSSEVEELTFNSYPEFIKWKEMIEAQTRSSFVKSNGAHKRKKEYTVSYFSCHRSGTYKPQGNGKRSLKRKGSVKIDGKCPAKMKVKCHADKVVVYFTKTHEGHNNELGKLVLTKKERDMIAEKIAMKIPFDDILDSIMDSLGPTAENISRLHLIRRHDLQNIAKCKNLNEAVKQKDDNISVDAWVKQLQESSNIIRLYKPQGLKLDEHPQLKLNDFFLIIARDAQLELLSAFGNECICIDVIHGLDNYNFQLYTIMVLDELQQGFPCSYLFSNREDAEAIELYFSVILKCLPSPISPKWFMSDMPDNFYDAWCAATVSDNLNTQQLYCSWHLDEAWRSALPKINNKEKQIEVYKKMKVIMQEPDVSTFYVMAENFMTELYADISTKNFAEYFEKFVHNPQCWAYCFRLNAGINTAGLENMHMRLKHEYLNGKKVYNLAKGIHALMRFTRERLYERFVALEKEEVTHSKLSDLRVKHKESLSLSFDNIHNISCIWFVPSSISGDCYEVVPANINCTCDIRCVDCKICIHYFRCTCLDATVKSNMCKHMHLVAQKMRKEGLEFSTDPINSCDIIIEGDESTNNFCDIIVEDDESTNNSSDVIVETVESTNNSCNVIVETVESTNNSCNVIVEAVESMNDSSDVIIEANESTNQNNEELSSESEITVEKVSKRCNSVDFIERKKILLEQFLAVSNMVESDTELEVLENIITSAKYVISNFKN